MTLAELLVKIKAEDKASPTIADLGKKLGDLNILGIASAAAIGTVLVKAFTACMDAAAENETVISKLNSVLKATSGVSGVTSQAAIKLAESLEEVTTFDKTATISGQTLLLTFRNIGENIFPQATESMLNLASVMGTDVKSAASAVGKALDNPTEGMGALQKAGVRLTITQKEQIEQFMALGNIAKAQEVVLGALASKMGGAARAETETYTGKIKQLGIAFGGLKESIGNIFLDLGKDVVSGITWVIQSINADIKQMQIDYWTFATTLADINAWMVEKLGGDTRRALAHQVATWTKLREAQGLISKGGQPADSKGKFTPSTDPTKEATEAQQKLEKIIQDFEIKKAQLAKDGLAQIKIEEQRSQQELTDTKLSETQKGEATKTAISNYYADLRAEYEKQKMLQTAQMAIQSMQQITSGLSGIFNQYMTNKNMELDNDLYRGQERINTEYEAEKARIENTTADERQKARLLKALDEKKARDETALQKKMEKEKRKAVREAAQYQKAIAITDAIINTARGITSALGMFPPPVAWAMAAITAALGAAQVALIAQQPLPAAAAGGVFNTPYVGGEAGTEMAVPLTGSQGQTAIQALASGMLDVMSQAVDTRATVSSASAGATGGGGDVYLDGSLVGQWISRGSNNGMFSINKKVVVS